MDKDAGLIEALKHKTVTELAFFLGVKHQAVSQWRRVPHLHVLRVEALTGVSRSILRPDIYPPGKE